MEKTQTYEIKSGSSLGTCLFTDHRHVNIFIRVLNFAVGLNPEIILTAKFSRSTVFHCIFSKQCIQIKKCYLNPCQNDDSFSILRLSHLIKSLSPAPPPPPPAHFRVLKVSTLEVRKHSLANEAEDGLEGRLVLAGAHNVCGVAGIGVHTK